MGALNRIATEVNAGAAIGGGGGVIEVAKHAATEDTPSVDIMLFDWIFWTDAAHLNTGGLIAIIGASIMIHGWWRGRKDRIRREEREKANGSIVRKTDG